MKNKIPLREKILKHVLASKKTRLIFNSSDLDSEPEWSYFWSELEFSLRNACEDKSVRIVQTIGDLEPLNLEDDQRKLKIDMLNPSFIKVSKALETLSDIQILIFADPSFTEETIIDLIEAIAIEAISLKLLGIRNIQLSEKWVFSFKRAIQNKSLINLKNLDLTNCQIHDKALHILFKTLISLESVILYGNNEFTAQCLTSLPATLKTLDIGGCKRLNWLYLKKLSQPSDPIRDHTLPQYLANLSKLRFDFPDGMDRFFMADVFLISLCKICKNLECLELGGDPRKGVSPEDVFDYKIRLRNQSRRRKPTMSAFRPIDPSEAKVSACSTNLQSHTPKTPTCGVNQTDLPVSTPMSPSAFKTNGSTASESKQASSSSDVCVINEKNNTPSKAIVNDLNLLRVPSDKETLPNLVVSKAANGRREITAKKVVTDNKNAISKCCSLAINIDSCSSSLITVNPEVFDPFQPSKALESKAELPKLVSPPKTFALPDTNIFGLGRGRTTTRSSKSSENLSKTSLHVSPNGLVPTIRIPNRFNVTSPQMEEKSTHQDVPPQISPAYDGFSGIGLLKNLIVLVIHTPIDGPSLLSISADCERLKELRLTCAETFYSDKVIKEMGQLRMQLEILELHSPKITNLCTTGIVAFKSLIKLDLSGTSVGDAVVQVVQECRQLVSLNMSQTKITKEGVRQCVQAANVREFDLTIARNSDMEEVYENLRNIPANVKIIF